MQPSKSCISYLKPLPSVLPQIEIFFKKIKISIWERRLACADRQVKNLSRRDFRPFAFGEMQLSIILLRTRFITPYKQMQLFNATNMKN